MCKRSLVRACTGHEFQRSSITSERPLWIMGFPLLSRSATRHLRLIAARTNRDADFLELTASFHNKESVVM